MAQPPRSRGNGVLKGMTGIVLMLAIGCLSRAARAQDEVVLVVSSRGSTIQQDLIRTFVDRLDRDCRATPHCSLSRTEVVTLGEDDAPPPTTPPSLAISVGLDAARWVHRMSPQPRVLHTLITEAEHAAIAQPGDSTIFLKQPLHRQLRLLRLALPGRNRVGFLLGPESLAYSAEIKQAAKAEGMQPIIHPVGPGEDPGSALRLLLTEAEVLLAIPDPEVFNRSTLVNILLSSYRKRIPLVGFSPAYVKAGAIAALYSSPENIGRDAAEMAAKFLAAPKKGLPPPTYPRYFSVSVNPNVPLSLGLRDFPSEDRLTQQLIDSEP